MKQWAKIKKDDKILKIINPMQVSVLFVSVIYFGDAYRKLTVHRTSVKGVILRLWPKPTFILSMMALVPRMLYFFSGLLCAYCTAQVVFPQAGRPTIIKI